MNSEFLSRIQEITQQNEPAWLLTVISASGSTPGKPGIKMILKADGSFFGTIGGGNVEKQAMLKVLNEKPETPQKWLYDLGGEEQTLPTGMICGGSQEIFVEPLFVSQSLYIIGGGHCGMALSEMASQCGFQVTVLDDRSEWAAKDKHPKAARTICLDYTEVGKAVPDNVYVVIMTHGHKHDGAVLQQFLKRNLKYLGMIGSKSKVQTTFERIKAAGFTESDLSHVKAPIGFPIGSQTPHEIAVSIMAQLIAVKYDKE